MLRVSPSGSSFIVLWHALGRVCLNRLYSVWIPQRAQDLDLQVPRIVLCARKLDELAMNQDNLCVGTLAPVESDATRPFPSVAVSANRISRRRASSLSLSR